MIWLWLVLLQTLALLAGVAWAVEPVAKSCPLVTQRYQAQPVQTDLTGNVGERIVLSFLLNPSEPPEGFFLSVKMNARQEPEAAKSKKPEILTGFPETSVLFRASGIYRYTVIVSLIAKSSCGGVKAETIFKGDVRIDISP